MLLLIDNYDSFTYNLCQYFGELGEEVQVVRNDALDTGEIAALAPRRIVISPGPGTPDTAGISMAVVQRFMHSVPILGVCLGHQAIGQALGGQVVHAASIMHGKTSAIYHDGSELYQGVSTPFTATRYHSLVLARDTMPSCLRVTAWTGQHEADEIMGMRHQQHALFGVQFHPESILTECGHDLLRNFLELS